MPVTSPLSDRLKACIEKHADWTDERIAAAIVGSTRAMVRALRAGEPIENIIEEQEKTEAGTITLAAVRARYDIAAAIREELARLKPGTLLAERELCARVAGKDVSRFRRTIENCSEFRTNRVKLRLSEDASEGTWYWGREDDIKIALALRDE